MSTKLNVLFAGTPDFAARHLQAFIHSEHNIVGVYTQPDRPAGRGKKLQPSAVKQLALEHSLPVVQPENFKSEQEQQKLADFKPDVMIVVAYGVILPQAVLDIPKYGCINVHGSLLPRWRGAAPIQRAIWAGDKETGVTIMQMDKGLDTGPMLHKSALPIEAEDTSASLYEKLADIGPKALLDTLEKIESIEPQIQQNDLANYAEKLSKAEAKIDWSTPAEKLERHIRAFNPWPVSYIDLPLGPVKVWQASVEDQTGTPGQIIAADKHGILVATSEQAIRITKLQIPGKKAMSAADIVNSQHPAFQKGSTLS